LLSFIFSFLEFLELIFTKMAQQVKEWLRGQKETETDLSTREQTVIITGAASGIGRSCLRWFAREGFHCVGIDLKFGDHHEFKKSLFMDLKDYTISLEECDVTNYELLYKLIEKYEKKNGFISCLINNAGNKCLGTIDSQNPDEWTRMIDVNVLGVLNGIRCVVGKMKEHKRGCIINIGDIGGHKFFPNHTVYCATKSAVECITEGVRREVFEYNVKVISINPGAVSTPSFTRSTDKDVEQKDVKWRDSLTHGILEPEDVARCCLFAYQQPDRCLIREIDLAPLEQDI
jgi:NADP-dependent 3-hydroxy acid dehydrogenase YdfG